MTNSLDPDQTAPIGASNPGPPNLVLYLNLSLMQLRQLFAAADFSRRHFSDAFFLAL